MSANVRYVKSGIFESMIIRKAVKEMSELTWTVSLLSICVLGINSAKNAINTITITGTINRVTNDKLSLFITTEKVIFS